MSRAAWSVNVRGAGWCPRALTGLPGRIMPVFINGHSLPGVSRLEQGFARFGIFAGLGLCAAFLRALAIFFCTVGRRSIRHVLENNTRRSFLGLCLVCRPRQPLDRREAVAGQHSDRALRQLCGAILLGENGFQSCQRLAKAFNESADGYVT